jgi:hypothetical protein
MAGKHLCDQLDFQEVTGPRSLHGDLTRQGMDRTRRDGGDVGDRRPRVEVAITGIPGLELLALADLDDRLDVGMPAVVPRPGLLGERLPAVDRDRPGHRGSPFIP